MPLTSLKEKARSYTTYKVKIYSLDFIRLNEYTVHICLERI